MSMSTNIMGYVSPEDETYRKHSKVLLACIEACIEELPRETAEYFGSPWPHESLLEEKLEVDIPKSEWHDDSSSGFEVEVDEIPEGVHKIRFWNSW